MRNFGNHFKCPVKGCTGFYTTTKNANIPNHVRAIAKTELLKRYLLKDNKPMPHAQWLKKNFSVVGKAVQIMTIGGKKFVINK